MESKLRNASLPVWILLWAALPALPASVEIVGMLQNVEGVPLSGTITVIQEGTRFSVTSHEVEEGGRVHIASDAEGELVIHAASPRHASAERVIPAGTAGVVETDFVLPLGQDAQVRVVDAQGRGVPGAAVRVRYHEPDRPRRRVAFDHEEGLTDGDGRLLLRDVGVGVPFVVDVLAPHYPPVSSGRMQLAAGQTEMEDIVLEERGAEVVAEVVDREDSPLGGAWVTLLADPAGLKDEARGSWLHHRAFRQRKAASDLGAVRFTGVPAGRVIVRLNAADGVIEERAIAVAGQELRVTLRAPR